MLKNYTKAVVNEYSTKYYLNDKEQNHHLDGPAVECKNGSKLWYINGKLHRNINPSTEYSRGDKSWYFKNKRHRIGGKAYYDYWFIRGKEYTKEEYYNIVWDI